MSHLGPKVIWSDNSDIDTLICQLPLGKQAELHSRMCYVYAHHASAWSPPQTSTCCCVCPQNFALHVLKVVVY